ncbi:hypothetical protein IGS68_11135 [Skermanella sp. TT6]|uniref:Uncharacterized protein n=1 Tax=Skermanella cutis TaxID=2775420 RepID=A0ABX7BC45_9PROT|nr:hypothetical protein [Skermanella sp. TT6]QQP91714.1 hypothetical protein IGS68_11135 [Skermanella sp. TT6]
MDTTLIAGGLLFIVGLLLLGKGRGGGNTLRARDISGTVVQSSGNGHVSVSGTAPPGPAHEPAPARSKDSLLTVIGSLCSILGLVLAIFSLLPGAKGD